MLGQQRFAGDFSGGVKTCSNFSLRRLVGVNPSRPGFGELPGASPANEIRKYLREAHGSLCGGPNLVAPQREIMPRQPQNKIRNSNSVLEPTSPPIGRLTLLTTPITLQAGGRENVGGPWSVPKLRELGDRGPPEPAHLAPDRRARMAGLV